MSLFDNSYTTSSGNYYYGGTASTSTQYDYGKFPWHADVKLDTNVNIPISIDELPYNSPYDD